MAVHNNRLEAQAAESFIPYRRADIIDLCIQDGKLTEAESDKFKSFCEILSAYYHFEFHHLLETLKENYVPFNPDADTKLRFTPTPSEQAGMEAQLVETFERVLRRANYTPLAEATLQRALEKESLIALKTQVDVDDFDRMVLYHRGDTTKTTSLKKLFRQVEVSIDIFERVVLLLKFKDAAYFQEKGQDTDFSPGRMHVYFYKNIPKNDLELLFPNVQIGMTWKDRLLLVVPALGAGVSVIIKALPNLLLIIGVILFFALGPSVSSRWGVGQTDVNNIMPILVAILSLVIALGGLAFKQYTSYKNKRLEFLKNVTETLFFRNLASNASVFNALIDAAEEEECKEVILVYYHLLTHKGKLSPAQLDGQIEEWMRRKFGTEIDFDIDQTLRQLEALHGDGPKVSLLTRDAQGFCHVLPLDEAKALIDQIWDNVFQFDSKAHRSPGN